MSIYLDVIWNSYLRYTAITVILESLALYLMGIRNKRDFLLMFLVNIITNISANLVFAYMLRFINRYVLLVLVEAAVVMVECRYIRRYFTSKVDPLKTSLILNVISFTGGILWIWLF